MDWFKKLPMQHPSPHGAEWALWKRLPTILVWGTALPLAVGLLTWGLAPAAATSDAEDPALLLTFYQLIGLVVLHWTLVLTVGIGCLIVRIMKGPAYVADAYPPPGREAEATGKKDSNESAS
jgi:hypothetical protein